MTFLGRRKNVPFWLNLAKHWRLFNGPKGAKIDPNDKSNCYWPFKILLVWPLDLVRQFRTKISFRPTCFGRWFGVSLVKVGWWKYQNQETSFYFGQLRESSQSLSDEKMQILKKKFMMTKPLMMMMIYILWCSVCLCVCVSRKIITSSWESSVTTCNHHNPPVQLRVSFHGFQNSRLVFQGSMSGFIGFQGLRLVFHGSRSVFMGFQGSRLVFHGSRLVFHGSRWVFMVINSSRSTFMVPGWFFMIPGRFLWFFHGSRSVFMVFQGSRLVFEVQC